MGILAQGLGGEEMVQIIQLGRAGQEGRNGLLLPDLLAVAWHVLETRG
jgi:hypothetical protein